MRPGGDDFEHLTVRGDRGDGVEATAEGLAQNVDVRDDALVVTGERAAGAGKSGLDLVGDHEDAGLVTDGPHVAEVALGRDEDASLPLHRLEQDGDGRVVHGRPQRLCVAEGDSSEAGRVRPVLVASDLVVGEAHDGRRAAVEVALHDDDRGRTLRDALHPVAPLPGHLHRSLDGLGARVHRQDHVLAGQVGEGLDERAKLVVEEGAARQGEPAQLFSGTRDQTWVTVTEVQRGVSGQAVEVPVSLDIRDPGSLPVAEDDGQRVVVVRGIPLDLLDVSGGPAGRAAVLL